MAQVPSEDEIKEAQLDTELQIADKKQSQEAQGKGFDVDPDGHAPGVVPEDIWQGHKEPSDE